MKTHKWLCTGCDRTGACAYFELSDMVNLPEMTIGLSHHTVSPDCTARKIHFVIEGQIFQWVGGGKEPQTSASLPDFVLAEDVLRLIAFYEQKVVIIDSKSLAPKARAQTFKNAIRNSERETEILVYDSLPRNPRKLFFSRIQKHISSRKHTVIFVGSKGSWKMWQYMLKKRRKFSLLRQSSRFYA